MASWARRGIPAVANHSRKEAPVPSDFGFNGIRQVPPPVNEPVKGYGPGSPEKASLKARLDSMAGELRHVAMRRPGAILSCDYERWHYAKPIDAAAMQRQFEVRALDMEGRILEEHNMFAGNGSYMPNIIFFNHLGTGDTVQIEFDFEGCGYVCLRNTGLYNAAPVLVREFDNGLVVANPSDYEVPLSLNAEDLHRTAQPYAWMVDYDQAVNDFSLFTNPFVIVARDGLLL